MFSTTIVKYVLVASCITFVSYLSKFTVLNFHIRDIHASQFEEFFTMCNTIYKKSRFRGVFRFFALQFTSIDRYFNNVLVNDFDIEMCKVINIFLNKFLLSVNFNKNFISVMEEAAKHANIVPVYFNVFYITMITYYELYTHCSIVH